MKRFVLLYSLFAVDFQSVLCVFLKNAPTLGFKNTPRLVSEDMVNSVFKHKVNQNHSVLFYDKDFEELYVGGSDFVFRLDVNDHHVLEEFNLPTTEQMYCQDHCENVITVIEKFQDSVFVCGTNGHKPQCWKLFSAENNLSQEIVESYEGTGISPYTYAQNSLSLTVDEDLYAVAPLESDGTSLQFRRSAGKRTNVWMYDKWVSEPTFISASWVKREDDDADNDKIYIFFREKNSDHNPEADPWISRVARVCKVDEGGSKRFFQNMWTSFVKARLVCGFPEESLYFNRLQDIYVMNAEDWRNTRVYALFTSSWNSTAVCIYTVGMIEEIFENSTFKGYDKEIPKPRPGTCVKNSKSLPLATINMVKDYPEMTDWVHSVHYKAPFYLSSNNYTKIAVDRVQAANNQMYNVLFLATDSGRIHKVLEAGSEPFIISETQLSNHSAIQSMKLDAKKKKLVVGFPEKISTVDLQKCEQYNKSCAECVLARDPYCAWTTSGCTPTVPEGIQNIMTGESSVCPTPEQEQKQINRSKRETASPSPSPSPSPTNSTTVHSVPLAVPFYLSCPIDSYHADYTWEHEGQSSPCLQMQSNCLHLIPAMAKENYGSYECVSKEKDYTKVVQRYHLEAQIIQVTKQRQEVVSTYVPERSNVQVIVPPVLWLALGLAIAGLSQRS